MENIYIHLPFCLKKCFYCSFPIHAVGMGASNTHHFEQMQNTYISNLIEEIRLTDKALFSMNESKFIKRKPLQSIYFGGGTPSLFSTPHIKRILDEIKDRGFEINGQTEITMECDPGTFDESKIRQYEDLQINRISLGIQSFNDSKLKLMNRSQDSMGNYEAIHILKNSRLFSSLDNVSFDLIMNLPALETDPLHQHPQNDWKLSELWKQDIEKSIGYMPGHLSIYSLAVEPTSYFYERKGYREGEYPLPSDGKAADIFSLTHSLLEDKYTHYEISSYVRKTMNPPKHNPIYWEGNKQFLAFGMGASSFIGHKRFTRPKSVAKYYEFISLLCLNPNFLLEVGEDESDIQSQIEAILMGRLRTKQGLDMNEIKHLFGDLIQQALLVKINQLVQNQGYPKKLSMDMETGLFVLIPPEGFLICDHIVAELSFHLQTFLEKINKVRTNE